MGATETPMYGAAIALRNCGRFVHVSADFGSDYSTHAHLSSEMLYAGLTRERSRTPRAFGAAMGAYRFGEDFDLRQIPLWFTVATVDGRRIRRDRHTFNSTLESTPGVQTNDRLPKYGQIETLLPDQRFLTIAVSPDRALLEGFEPDQVFWMGKKRTMFQIVDALAIHEGRWEQGPCTSPPIQIGPGDVEQFDRMEVIAATQRCLVVRGHLRNALHLRFDRPEQASDAGVPAMALGPLLAALGA